MVNVTNVISEFRAADLQAYIDTYTLGELQFRQYFPTIFTPFLTYEGLAAKQGATVAADVVSFDSRATRKGRNRPGKVSGDIPKIEISRPKTETDLNVYRQLVASIGAINNDVAKAQAMARLVDWMYEDSTFALNGVNARAEWLAKQICSTGKYKLTLDNNEAGVQTTVDVDFRIPTANIANASANWYDPAATTTSYKPITDIKAVDKAARAKGVKLRYAITDQETYDKIAASDEAQKFCASYINNAVGLQTTPNIGTFNSALSSAGLPQFRIWDSYITLEKKDGTQDSTSGWETGRITFSTTPTIGETQWTNTADAFVTIDESTKAQNDFVLVKTYAIQDPINVITKGVAYATPVLQNRDNIYILKTKTA